MLSKLVIEIYLCFPITAGIERVFSVADHRIGTRATTMEDENFEKKLFCNVNQQVMMPGANENSSRFPERNMVRLGFFNQFVRDSFEKSFSSGQIWFDRGSLQAS